MNIGEKIRKIRVLKGYSQDYMAIKLDKKQESYSNIELGKTKISTELIEDIAKIFEMPPEDNLTFDEKHFSQPFTRYKQTRSLQCKFGIE